MERFATLSKRPGYAAAMRVQRGSRLARVAVIAAGIGCGCIAYACLHSVSAAWLRWFLVILFGVLAACFLMIFIGMSIGGTKLPVAVVDKRLDGSKHRVTFLRENGARMELAVSDEIYGLLKPGDLGVVQCSGSEGDYTVDGFQRL